MFDEIVECLDSIENIDSEIILGCLEDNLSKMINLDTLQEVIEVSSNGLEVIGNIFGALFGTKDIIDKIKGVASIQNSMFVKKIVKFLTGIASIPIKKREKFCKKFEKELKKDSDRILNLINKIDNGKKIDYIVILFTKLVNEDIDFSMFFRLASVVERCHFEDLKVFLSEDDFDVLDIIVIESLLNVGLIYDAFTKKVSGMADDSKTIVIDSNQAFIKSLIDSGDYKPGSNELQLLNKICEEMSISDELQKQYKESQLGKELKKQLNSEVNYE